VADPSIDRLRPDELNGAIASTSRAFWPDPLFGFFARDEVHEHRVMPIFLGAMIRDASKHGQVWAARDGERVVGSASWLPPGALPRGQRREARIYAACARALTFGRNRRVGLRLLDLVEKHHPTEPHWYLAVLGVDPRLQGRGLGRALVQPVLDRCDREIVPAYLETQKPENLPFYERFGFRVTDEIGVPGSPSVWLMWRDPDPTRLES
jgi:GNAT superfamily N-acetyltransferase